MYRLIAAGKARPGGAPCFCLVSARPLFVCPCDPTWFFFFLWVGVFWGQSIFWEMTYECVNTTHPPCLAPTPPSAARLPAVTPVRFLERLGWKWEALRLEETPLDGAAVQSAGKSKSGCSASARRFWKAVPISSCLPNILYRWVTRKDMVQMGKCPNANQQSLNEAVFV